MVEIITRQSLADLIFKTPSINTSPLSNLLLKFVDEMLILHPDHNPVLGIADMLNIKDLLVLVMWRIPFNDHTVMFRLNLTNLNPSSVIVSSLFEPKVLNFNIYIGKGDSILFRGAIAIAEEFVGDRTMVAKGLLDWHRMLVTNNYDLIEDIAPDFLSHILDATDDPSPEVVEALARQIQIMESIDSIPDKQEETDDGASN